MNQLNTNPKNDEKLKQEVHRNKQQPPRFIPGETNIVTGMQKCFKQPVDLMILPCLQSPASFLPTVREEPQISLGRDPVKDGRYDGMKMRRLGSAKKG